MQKKYKIIILSSGVVLLIILFKIILEFQYRSNIPDMPGKESITEVLRDQISAATRKAWLNPSSNNLGILGMIYHSSSDYQRAAECYNLAAKRNKSKWMWNYYLGYLNKEMGESPDMVHNFEQVVKTNPAAHHAWYYLGEGYQYLGEMGKAEEALKRISSLKEIQKPANKIFRTDHFPMGIYASFLLGKLYLNTGKIDSSQKVLTELITSFRTFGPAYSVLGNIYQIKGDSVTGKNYIAQANDLLPVTAPADTLLDIIALRSRSELFILKQIDEASNTYYKDWALTLADHALNYLPENKYLVSKFIKLLFDNYSGITAVQFLDDHLKNFSEDFEELKQVGDLLYEHGFYSESRPYYNRALELRPESTDIQANMVFSFLNEDKKEEGLALLKQYLEKDQENPGILTNAVYTMLLTDDYGEAENYLNSLKKITPGSTKVLLLSGFIAQQKGDTDKARVLFETAFRNNPEELICAQSLGDVLIRQKMWRRSIEHFSVALEYFPNEPFIIEKLGSLLATCPDPNLRDYNKGIQLLERLMIHRACPAEIKISAGKNLVKACTFTGQKEHALSYLRYITEFAGNYNAPREVFVELEELLKELNK
ncbi:MAG: hypothetical protein JXN62_14205 [Bacteroidales bacterium]|nr:hypothetical protein [Bacteroidales bacterium]